MEKYLAIILFFLVMVVLNLKSNIIYFITNNPFNGYKLL